METFNYSTYQYTTSLEDLPYPQPLLLPLDNLLYSWTIPFSFNFSFPDDTKEPAVPHYYSAPVEEVFTSSVEDSFLPSTPVKISDPDTSSTGTPSSTPTTSPTSCDLSREALVAQSLHDEKQWEELKDYISNTSPPVSDHSYMQSLFYTAVYEMYKMTSGKRRLEPTTRYRLRKSNPLPLTISAVKFKSNNFFDSDVKSLMNAVFKRTRIPSSENLQNLSENTGLTLMQIRSYFKNKRSRK